MATLGLVAIPSHFIPMDDTISSIVLLIGMAVGVDYTLFYLRREREERRRGATGMQAIDTAAATSGRAVLISGFTVMAAMAGMFLAGDRTFTSLGVGVDPGRGRGHDRVADRRPGRSWPRSATRSTTAASRCCTASSAAATGARGPGTRSSRASCAAPRSRPGRGHAARRPGAPGARHAHRADRHRRPAAQARGHAGLRPDAGRVPRRADPGDGRGHRARRHDPAAPGRDPATSSARPSPRAR